MLYVTIPQAAAILNVSRQRVLLLVQASRIPARRLGRTWMIERSKVQLPEPIAPGRKSSKKA